MKSLNQSRVNLLLSRQEGSNRSLFEGFFAGVPGLALRNNIGIPKGHFNSETGRLIGEGELAGALLDFREHWGGFRTQAMGDSKHRSGGNNGKVEPYSERNGQTPRGTLDSGYSCQMQLSQY